ncbi:hypothetical protein ACFL1H_03185 [Nanoarchaeota archaeon]
MKKLSGYFDYLGNKTYIDKYPETIIKNDDLFDKKIMEMGCGTFNDMMYLIDSLVISWDDVYISEPYIPAFCQTIDKIDKICGDGYCYENRLRISDRPLPNKDLSDECVDFVYSNNVLHALAYKSLEEKLDYNFYHEKKIYPCMKEKNKLFRVPNEKLVDVLKDVYRILDNEGVFFGRTLSAKVDMEVMEKLKNKKDKTKAEQFTYWTGEAVLDGTLMGLNPNRFSDLGKYVGFSKVKVIEEEPNPEKPRRNLYFRFEK